MSSLQSVAEKVLPHHVVQKIIFDKHPTAEELFRDYAGFVRLNESRVSKEDIALFRCALLSKYHPLVQSGKEVCRRTLSHTTIFSTFSQRLNDALGGGLYTCDFLEAYGKSGVGKTQLALHISAHACMRSNVLYVDTNGDFTALRLIQILSKHCPLQKPVEKYLQRVRTVSLFHAYDLLSLLRQIISAIKQKKDEFYHQLRLLVIDNVMTLLSPVIGYRLYEGHWIGPVVGKLLRRLSSELNVAVLTVNGTVSGSDYQGRPKAALGLSWQSMAHKRLLVVGYDESDTHLFNTQLTYGQPVI